MDRQARAVGARLQSMGATGERVLLLYPPGLEFIAAFFGCLYAGAIAVPTYPPRPHRSLIPLQAIALNAQATVALTTTALLAKVSPALSEVPGLKSLRWITTDDTSEDIDRELAAEWQQPILRPTDIAFLQYTSGSTALPKGVMISHANVLHNAAVIQTCFKAGAETRGVFWLPFYHDMGLIGGLLQTLYCGATSTFLQPMAFLQQPFTWLQAISQTRANTSGGPNFAYELCVNKITQEERATLDLSSWDLAFNGAEPIRQETLERFAATYAPCGFRWQAFYPCYGVAEATLIVFEASTVSELAEKIESASSTDAAPDIDLQREVVLDPTITPQFGVTALVDNNPARILLTGATGFLGAFLLSELLQQTEADVYCLVREINAETGMRKLRTNLESFSLWHESFGPRIVPVLGDLSQPLLGLSDPQFQKLAGEIEVIYHNGASVNATYPYSALKATNVLGTQEVLRLACQGKPKPLHFVSTLSVLAHDGVANSGVILEQDDLDLSEGIAGGYAQSKWVAEKLVTLARSRGLPVSIYRPGRITGHSQTGICNANDLMGKMIKISFQLGSVPEMDTMVDLTPVDYVSKAIVYLSRQKESLGKAFHLFNPRPLHWADLVKWLRSYGYSFQQSSYDEWRMALRNNSNGSMGNGLSSLMRFLYESHSQESGTVSRKSEKAVPAVRLDCQNTLNGLAGSSVACPPVDAELLNVYFSYFIESGLLPSPSDRTSEL